MENRIPINKPLDDIAPDGSANTACQLNLENMAKQGKLVEEKVEIAKGIYKVVYYLVVKTDD